MARALVSFIMKCSASSKALAVSEISVTLSWWLAMSCSKSCGEKDFFFFYFNIFIQDYSLFSHCVRPGYCCLSFYKEYHLLNVNYYRYL